MKRILKLKPRMWAALALGICLIVLSFDDQIVETMQLWGSDPSQVQQGQVPSKEVEQSANTAKQQSAQLNESSQSDNPEVTNNDSTVEQESTLTEQKYQDLVAAAGDKNPAEKFFAEYRLERERIRGQQVEWLREIVNNPKSAEQTRKEAQQKLLSITDTLSKELLLENMLKAKNYNEAIVFLQERNITVIVQTPELTSQDLTKISDLVARTTGKSAEDMVIIPKR